MPWLLYLQGKSPRNPFYKRLAGPLSRSGCDVTVFHVSHDYFLPQSSRPHLHNGLPFSHPINQTTSADRQSNPLKIKKRHGKRTSHDSLKDTISLFAMRLRTITKSLKTVNFW
jgi:hypothetical protein